MEKTTTAEMFTREWRRYLRALWSVSLNELKKKNHPAFERHLTPLLNDVFERLLSADADTAIFKAVQAQLEEGQSREAIDFLHRELVFFVAWKGGAQQGRQPAHAGAMAGAGRFGNAAIEEASGTPPSQDDGDDGDAVAAGKTIKDSVEKLIEKMPPFVRHTLNVLNELLSIIRGGG